MDIRTIRTRYQLTQEELATALGVSVKTIYRYEQGKTIPRKQAIHLALLFHALAKKCGGPMAPCPECDGTGLVPA